MNRFVAALAVALAAAACSCPKAHADDGDGRQGPDPNVVGGMFDAGVPPAEIPHDVIRNDPRVNSPTLPWQVFRDLQNRP